MKKPAAMRVFFYAVERSSLLKRLRCKLDKERKTIRTEPVG